MNSDETTRSQVPAPLRGIRVVEFTHMVMGPAVGAILVELGAEVIKVEPVGGDATRQLRGSGAGYFSMYNRNKKSVCRELGEMAVLLGVKGLVGAVRQQEQHRQPPFRGLRRSARQISHAPAGSSIGRTRPGPSGASGTSAAPFRASAPA